MDVKFSYTGIRVKDLEASVKFYTRVLGMKEVERFSQPATKGTVAILVMHEGGHQLELNYYPRGSRFDTRYEVGEGLDHLGFETTDLDRVLAEAREAGYPTILEMQDSNHLWAYIQDPNGIWIEFFVPPG
ncbi:MAG TPA: VOC family protein [Thermoplasmata archaeon]|jgi:lactoylglutathione lyase|nr:VOC family protein [Thermoplasmata archaeon]